MKSLDKKKSKELDWDTLGIKEIFLQWLFFNGKLTGKEAEELWNKLSLIFKATITQQRTEILEGIKDLQTYVLFNDTEKLISLEKVKSLLNKKDDR